MAEDGSPEMYSHPPRESARTPTEAAVFFGADGTIPRSEPTITSEGDHVSPGSEHTPEGDFSVPASKLPTAKEKRKLEEHAETHAEKEVPAPTETTHSTASEGVSESFRPVKIGSILTPVGTVSLIDFPSTLAKEDSLSASRGAGGRDGSPTAQLSGADSVQDAPALATEKAETDAAVDPCSVRPHVPDDEAAQGTEALTADAEIPASAEKDVADNPDPSLAKGKVAGTEQDPNVVSELSDNDEKFITVFELTSSVEKDKGDPEERLTDESPDGTKAWEERETADEAETHSVLLTAVESRYDFIAPAPGTKSFKGDAATSIAPGSSENAATHSVIKVIEPLSADGPALDTPDSKEEPSNADTGVFKLLKEDPDEFMM